MTENRVLGYLGLARKAGRLAVGFAASKDAVISNKAKLIAVANDVSPKSEKEIVYHSKGNCSIVRLNVTITELSHSIGTKAGIVAVCDDGFAAAILKLADRT